MACQLTYDQFEGNAKNLIQNLLDDKHFTDVTIACDDGRQFQAHKCILSLCSPLLKRILVDNSYQKSPLLYFHSIGQKKLEILLPLI